MSTLAQVVMMAAYNQWMNVRMFEAAARLSADELASERGAFFGSILGTLNHIVVGDTIWLQRFATHPAKFSALDAVCALPVPAALNQILFADLAGLAARRKLLDASISDWAENLDAGDLEHLLEYANTKGVKSRKRFGSLVMHFFNHQTHHRGQASTLLFQAGEDIGVTDLLALIPNQPTA